MTQKADWKRIELLSKSETVEEHVALTLDLGSVTKSRYCA